MAIYLKSKNLEGSVTAKDYKNCVDVHNYRLSHFRRAAQLSGHDGPRNVGINQRTSVVFTKSADNATGDLYSAYTKAENMPEFTFYHVVGNNDKCYQRVTFKDVQIDSIDTHATADGIIEEVEFSFTQQEIRVMASDATGKPMKPYSVGYDFAKLKSI